MVLEDENQRQADINEATRKVRRTLTAQLQKREDEIETLKEQNKLTESEYQKKLQELYDNQSKSEQLVKEMAERYASTDYDQLDEFNRQVQMYIEEGELQKADSMIRSKGDIEKRVEEYQKIVKANREERENLNQREQLLEQSENGDLFLNKFGITEQEKAWCEKSHMALKALRASMLTEMHLVEEALLLAKECYAYDSQDPYCKLTYAQCLNNYSCTIAANYDFNKALAMIEEAIAIIPNEANFYDSKGEILLMQGKNQEALEMWNKVLELNPNFLNDFPNGTNLSNGLKKLGLIE